MTLLSMISDLGNNVVNRLQPNGLRVLGLIPGVVERIKGFEIQKLMQISALEGHEQVLGQVDTSYLKGQLGFAITGVQRAALHKLLLTVAEEHGVEVKWGHHAVCFEQSEDEVQVTFENGHKDTASFVVGCDGLHSDTRIALFGYEKPEFTGQVQTGGFAPSSVAYERSATLSIYHDGKHMLTHPFDEHRHVWIITSLEAETKEDRGDRDAKMVEETKRGPLSAWAFGAGDLVKNATKITKYGLYDRPELKTWHKGRIVLLGDAAHPTSPHLGQGASQSFEDIYHLIRVLLKYNPDGGNPSTDTLDKAFAEYEFVRIPASTKIVKSSRAQGEFRAVEGLENGLARNKKVQEDWKDEAISKQRMLSVLSGSFKESEI